MGAVGCEQCSCITPVGSNIKQKTKMAGFSKVCLLLLVATSALGQRAGKNLHGTFPFNTRNGGANAAHHGAHHGHHEEHHAHHSGDDVALDIGSIAAAGERCIDKVVMVQETEYDDVITCKHSYSEKCHTTYATDFTPQHEEKCEENFKKSCFIEYKKKASPEKVQLCYTPLVKNCNTTGPTECSTEYTSECTTRYEQHDVSDDTANCEDIYEEKCEDVTQGYSTEQKCTKWPVKKCKVENGQVKKFSPVTECKKVPFELCGPGSCPVEPGPEECREETQTVVIEVPEETCNLEPQRICKHVTKLVPHLVSREIVLIFQKKFVPAAELIQERLTSLL